MDGDSPESLLIKRFEGRFKESAFPDGAQDSIGFGTKANSPDEKITVEEAQSRLESRVAEDKGYVERFAEQNDYDWNSDQITALTSFIYNLGKGALAQVTDNGTRDEAKIAEMMLLYFNSSDPKNKDGLIRRRQEEQKIFLGK